MLSTKDYTGAANFLGCDIATIQAVTHIEAPRGAYDSEGHITILFEPYQFYKELKKLGIDPDPYVKEYPTLCSPKWDSSLYGKYSEQYNKLQGAANINPEAAYKSASYGLFQIMGFNYIDLGFKDVYEFYQNQVESEYNQLIAFCKYVKFHHLDSLLQRKEWAEFAKAYNGPGFKDNQYDTKLKLAYLDYVKA